MRLYLHEIDMVRFATQLGTGCNKLPSFNYPGVTPAARCGSHREDGMVNVRHRVCQHEGCGTEAKYNLPGEQHGAYCGQHKLKDMERVNTRRCCFDGCDKRASFNSPGEPGPAASCHVTFGC
jgi:hypothetical protein